MSSEPQRVVVNVVQHNEGCADGCVKGCGVLVLLAMLFGLFVLIVSALAR